MRGADLSGEISCSPEETHHCQGDVCLSFIGCHNITKMVHTFGVEQIQICYFWVDQFLTAEN
jgi:hypothetical protein